MVNFPSVLSCLDEGGLLDSSLVASCCERAREDAELRAALVQLALRKLVAEDATSLRVGAGPLSASCIRTLTEQRIYRRHYFHDAPPCTGSLAARGGALTSVLCGDVSDTSSKAEDIWACVSQTLQNQRRSNVTAATAALSVIEKCVAVLKMARVSMHLFVSRSDSRCRNGLSSCTNASPHGWRCCSCSL